MSERVVQPAARQRPEGHAQGGSYFWLYVGSFGVALGAVAIAFTFRPPRGAPGGAAQSERGPLSGQGPRGTDPDGQSLRWDAGRGTLVLMGLALSVVTLLVVALLREVEALLVAGAAVAAAVFPAPSRPLLAVRSGRAPPAT